MHKDTKNLFTAITLLISCSICIGMYMTVISYLNANFSNTMNFSSIHSSGPSFTMTGTSLLILLMPIYLFIAPLVGSYSDYVGRKQTLFSCLIFATFSYLLSYYSFSIRSYTLLYLSLALSSFLLCVNFLVFAFLSEQYTRLERAASFILLVVSYTFIHLAAYATRYLVFTQHYLPKHILLFGFSLLLLCMLLVTPSLFTVEIKEIQAKNNMSFISHFSQQLNRIMLLKTCSYFLVILFLFLYSTSLSDRSIASFSSEIQYLPQHHSTQIYFFKNISILLLSIVTYLYCIRKFNFYKLSLSLIALLCFFQMGFLFFSLTHWLSSITALVNDVAFNLVYPLLLYLLIRNVRKQNYGLIFGLISTINYLCWCLGNITTLTLQENSYQYPFMLAFILICIALLLLMNFYVNNKAKPFIQLTV